MLTSIQETWEDLLRLRLSEKPLVKTDVKNPQVVK